MDAILEKYFFWLAISPQRIVRFVWYFCMKMPYLTTTTVKCQKGEKFNMADGFAPKQ